MKDLRFDLEPGGEGGRRLGFVAVRASSGPEARTELRLGAARASNLSSLGFEFSLFTALKIEAQQFVIEARGVVMRCQADQGLRENLIGRNGKVCRVDPASPRTIDAISLGQSVRPSVYGNAAAVPRMRGQGTGEGSHLARRRWRAFAGAHVSPATPNRTKPRQSKVQSDLFLE